MSIEAIGVRIPRSDGMYNVQIEIKGHGSIWRW